MEVLPDTEVGRARVERSATEPAQPRDRADSGLLTVWRSAASRLLIAALAVVSLLVLAFGFVVGSDAIRLIGAFSALIFGAGAAPLQLADRPVLGERIGMAVMLGLAVMSLVGGIITLAPVWQPFLFAALIGLAATAAHAIGVGRSLRSLRRAKLRVFPQLYVRGRPRSAHLSSAAAIVGTALWLGAALGLGHVDPGLGGFLPRISVAWYAGLAMLVVAIVLARNASEAHVAAPVLLLIAAITLTPALLYGSPESQSAVKHVLLVQHVLATHHLHADGGLYYAYSGFFDGIAWLCRLANVTDPSGLATYWPLLIGLLGAIELRFLLGRVIRSGHRCWLGVLVGALANAVGQNYFSPQSDAFVIALGVFALVIVGTTTLAIPHPARIAFLVLSGCALAITHELTPYLAGGVLVVLAVFGLAKPRWAALALIVPAAGWALAHPHSLSGYINFNNLGNISNFTPPPRIGAPGLARSAWVGYSTDALVLGLLIIVGLAMVGFIRNRRRAGAWGFVISAGVGLVFIAVNPYGDEGIFRASLFAIPWLAMLGLAAVRKPRWRWGAFGVLGTVLVTTSIISNFSLDSINVVRAADVRVLHAYIRAAPPGSYHLELAADGDIPSTLDPNLHNLQWDPLWNPKNPHVLAVHSVAPPTLGDVNRLTDKYIAYASTISGTPAANLFAVYSPTAARSSAVYALETRTNSLAWLHLFLRSPRWRLLYATDGAYLFRYAPPVLRGSRSTVLSTRSA